MWWRPSSFINLVLIAWQLAPPSVCVLGADVSPVSNDQVVFFALEINGLDYDKLLTNTAMLSAVRTNIAQAVATEVGKGVAVSDVETVLSKGTSADGAGVGSVLAEVWITPPDGVRSEDIRDALLNSSKLGESVASGVHSVNTGIGTKAAGGSTVSVQPFTAPVLRDRGQGLNFMMIALLGAGVLSMLAAFLVCRCIGDHSLSKARTKFFGPTEEEELRARRANMLICCATTKKDYKMVSNADEGGWVRRSRAW
mmetsp:Transcript_58812/g.152852  ORF Transcript_58812/g.152852 Transcript_58812/m.152852 type:complete len:254 (-) Transcript_58812:128-889(-)